MAAATRERQLYRAFAQILEYPRPGLVEAARECEALLAPASPPAAALLGEFRRVAEELTLARLEEIYTGTFDLDASLYPYVGYHLFGESYKRSVFLLGLQERYQAQGFTVEADLPDHLAVMLRFLAVSDDAQLAEELIAEALLPALERLAAAKEADAAGGEPAAAPSGAELYRRALQALQLALRQQAPVAAQP